jgi:hypothetical protein
VVCLVKRDLYTEDAPLQRKRYVVDRTLSWLKGFHQLRYRVDRAAATLHAFVYLAVLVLCVRRLVSPSPDGDCVRSGRFGHAAHRNEFSEPRPPQRHAVFAHQTMRPR